MRRSLPLTLLVILAACQASPGPLTAPMSGAAPAAHEAMPSFQTQKARTGAPVQTGRFVATLAPGAKLPPGYRLVRPIAGTDQVLVEINTLTSPVDVQRAMMRLQGMPDVLSVRPEHRLFVFGMPNDPDFKRQWNMHKVLAPDTWDLETGSKNPVTVAVIDTGIDLDHPDLAPRLVPGIDVIRAEDRGRDGNGHGTHVAGVIGAVANNGKGIAGMNWGARLMPVRVMGSDGSGSDADIAEGIQLAVDSGAQILNLSIGGYEDSDTIRRVIANAVAKNVLVVAAMGNDSTDNPAYPAALPGVLAVGATDSQDSAAKFSNHGSWMGVCAPGVGIFSTLPTYPTRMPHRGPYGALSGTSMAAPLVAGLASLIWSRHPDWSAAQVKQRIEQTADDLGPAGHDPVYGHGRINALRALTD